jgi:hypothetical protein
MGEALGGTRLGPIAVWTLLSVGVGVLLSRSRAGSREAGGSTWLAGAAGRWRRSSSCHCSWWKRGRGPRRARSASLIEALGEGIAGSLTISAWLIMAVIGLRRARGRARLAHSEPGVASS